MFASSVIASIACVSLYGQALKDFTGKWSMVSETDSEPVKWTLTVSGTADKPLVTLSTGEGQQPARDPKFHDGTLTFNVEYQGDEYTIALKYVDGRLDGTWSGSGNSGKTYGNKAS